MSTTLSNIISIVLAGVTIGSVLLFFALYFQGRILPDHRRYRLEKAAREEAEFAKSLGKKLPTPIPKAEKKRFSFHQMPYHPMEKKDRLPLIVITLLYMVVALFQLGSFSNPQTFVHLTEEESVVTVELDELTNVSGIRYYTGLYSGGTFTISLSPDGEVWVNLPEIFEQYNTLFKWQDTEGDFPLPAKFIRIYLTDGTDLALGELAIYDESGALIPSNTITTDALGAALLDESDVIPEEHSWENSTYFDEVYHARTAYEHLNNIFPYENSHPPLGKLIMALGISIFGMVPFGWRIMGTLFGVAMLPPLYLFLKNLFGKTPIAVCGTLLFAFDFMHFAQTRIATIDTYSVFFVLLSFFFLYRYFVVPREKGFFKGEALPLALCGLSFGVGAACKWTVIYAGAGLCILYFWNLILRWRQEGKQPGFYGWLIKTLLWSVLFFVAIPLAIYTACYIPYALATGNSVWYEMIENQKFMFTYHNGVHQEHPYSSRWWQWILNIRPILYYVNYFSDGTKSAIASFGNPMVVWGGLLSLAALIYHAIRHRSSTAVFLFTGWLINLLPWIVISRTEFEYHYFGSILFLAMAVTFVLNDFWDGTEGKCKKLVYGYTGFALGLFALFYPILSGLRVSRDFCIAFLKWFPSWPLG